jgi:hypothetical protein
MRCSSAEFHECFLVVVGRWSICFLLQGFGGSGEARGMPSWLLWMKWLLEDIVSAGLGVNCERSQ